MKHTGLEKWKLKKILFNFVLLSIVGIVFLSVTCGTLNMDKQVDADTWNTAIQQSEFVEEAAIARSADAITVNVGTQIENIREISLKDSSFRAKFLVWFAWEGEENLNMLEHFNIYKGEINNMTAADGKINRMEILKDYHENGVHYQLARCDATVSKNFRTQRFPLDSHQLVIRVQSTYPVEKIVFAADTEKSSYNNDIEVTGYNLQKHEVAVRYAETMNNADDPQFSDENFLFSECVTAIEISRDGFGLYIKCFIALGGTLTWMLIVLFIATYHSVDPIRMVPAALFGTVANIMVGANLLPDALQMGLLEYVNIWGIVLILAGALSVIHINHIRTTYKDEQFASFFGRLMFYTMLTFSVVGNLVLPLSAYMF
ncbi:MAG: hypothetical protein RR956_07600 [Christensenella sp.]